MSDRIPTIGDLCSAIADGYIATTIDDSMYELSVFEVRRYLNRYRSLPTPTLASASEQASTLHSDTDTWPTSRKIPNA
ncbi:MAG: hypothetical protein M3Z24_00465 [Chloroflexota bacterium]|nr:hypothetical protein [Chloroflexota bacterium]